MDRPVGLLGGTFDPVHNGHIEIAAAALAAFSLQQVLFIPAAQPPHKHCLTIAASEHRAAMIRLALAPHPHLALSTIELERAGPSYTVSTLRELNRAHPENTYHLIIGGDVIPELHLWRDATEVLERGAPIVVSRPGSISSPAELREKLSRSLATYAAPLSKRFLSVKPNTVSSSGIRAACRAGQDISAHVPAAVAAYIEAHALYRRPAGTPPPEALS